MNKLVVFISFLAVVTNHVCADELDYVKDVRPILQKHCYQCHGDEKQKSGLRLDIKSEAFKGGDGWGPSIVPGKSDESPLFELVSESDEDSRMPPEGKPLSDEEIQILKDWIDQGAKWPDGVDLAKLDDPLDHWSFKPIGSPKIPTVVQTRWPRKAIDHFILERLQKEGLSPTAETTPGKWLRRVTLDLTGLPPTVKEVSEFLQAAKKGNDAYVATVNRLLASPRYGERWAQHWLDVVRYADTHGFEVNTERPHAWPYRDYVIAAFNNDTPYDQFIREQIAGDALGKDAATGFLVTASVLLPGQIGKDAPSMRLARQDALDEIVNNIGQTFLGLSVGCARCHNHKFDPISAKDYYSMQAFVAGVEYADREVPLPESERLKKSDQVKLLRQELMEIDRQLSKFGPLARPVQNRSAIKDETTNAKKNSLTFAPTNSRYVRFIIHDSNLHPTLGLIEPCIDEFEIYTDEDPTQNIALASRGTKVVASGSNTSSNHKLEHINDGKYGNSRSWMSNQKGQGWVTFELPKATRISRIVWSRDRNGTFTDRLPTAYALEAGLEKDSLKTLVQVFPKRPALIPSINTDRFSPIRSKRLRFTIQATNSLEPCIDELEVFNTAGENVALSTLGTTVTTSGDKITADRHEPRFLNDGRYGNSSSWMSSDKGKGWVQLEFSSEQEIERVAWGRDRQGKFTDRLATQYRIEIEKNNQWQVVADWTDRKTRDANAKDFVFSKAGLSFEEIQKANSLLQRKNVLAKKIDSLNRGTLVFAGKFRKPDEIHQLSRGDPEQPLDPVRPAVLSAIGKLELPKETSEQDRRQALADWIANPQNPLTARVMVNRVWQWHFGIGLVDTANDFGRNGSKPTHPELLDWLARDFINSGWSIKHLHRQIVLSATYRQATGQNAKAAATDADVRLLWRYPFRRIEAEAIRDGMLVASGQLNLKTGGRGFDLFKQRGGLSGFTPIETFSGDGLRRMIYAHKVRRERDAVFGAFDCPDAGQSTSRRIESTTPIQALNLLNSRFTIQQSEAFANRIRASSGDDPVRQIRQAYKIALNREPTAVEIEDAKSAVQIHGLATLCRALFNCNEFLFFP